MGQSSLSADSTPPISIFWYSLIGLFFLVAFVALAIHHEYFVNTDMTTLDQSAYMHEAEKLHTTNFQHVTSRVRMPLYPMMMSLFYRENMTEDEYFVLGKTIGIEIAVIVLCASLFLFTRYVRFIDAFVATLVTGITVFAFKCPYFKPEILFFGLSLALFVLMCELVQRPRIGLALATGVLGAIAHLTKASVLLGLILCFFFLVLDSALKLRTEFAQSDRTLNLGAKRWLHVLRPVLCACFGAAAFLAVTFPYIRTSKIQYGRYFYNANTTFYVWYDSWDEAQTGTKAHGDRDGWPHMPSDQIPSMSKYFHEHSMRQIAWRFAKGANVLRSAVLEHSGEGEGAPVDYALFFALYFCLVLLLTAQNSRQFVDLLGSKTYVLPFFFSLIFFTFYFLAYAWFMAINAADRYVLALYLPGMLSMIRVIDFAERHDLCCHVLGRRVRASSISPMLLMALLVQVLLIFPDEISGGLMTRH